MKKIDINEMKAKYVNQTFGWLTVIDVYKDESSKRYFFKCLCKCGKETCKPYNKVISGHTSSCGCYRFSKEYSDSLIDYWNSNPDKVKSKTDKVKQWIKDNPDKVAERGQKHSQFYKDNPEILISQKEKRRHTLENNPSIQETINENIKLSWTDEKRDEFSKERKQYYIDHPEVSCKVSSSLIKFYKDNPNKKTEISSRNKKWCENNKDKLSEFGKNHSDCLKSKRLSLISNNDVSTFLEVLHPSQKESFLNGNIKSLDEVLVRCSICGEYESRTFNNVWRLEDCRFKNGRTPVCAKCLASMFSSSCEDVIANFISTFYNGECIRNSRNIIAPLELDLYYPEKKIAIEYNGNYWHNEDQKSNDYHYNKFKLCYDTGITLVSIFEKDWDALKENIILYIKDLFSAIDNPLSHISNNTINLNFPPPLLNISNYVITENFYISRDKKVFTCGCATNTDYSNDLLFITDLADKNGLSYFINNRGDLEIHDKNICFHLANMTSGEKDSYDRWYYYHSIGVRCVFVYPPDLSNENKINVYKNILLYHCKLTKRIYARNTVVAKYPAIKMKSFFDENNIAGYRNSKTAYVLEDKITHEPYMCYLIGHSYFGKGNYDCEIARGACKLGYSIIGGASKLWKYILNDNPTINSIVYYCDRRQYDQRSISHLMDSSDIKNLGHVYMLNGNTSFMNYWVKDSYINDKLWHRSGEYTNREPHNHKFVADAINKGYCISVYNPGSFVNVFVRKGYHLDGLKVVRD